jgi:UDP-3-O-[3-hydroxymyristoyl] N-acetylglucosamine deacetylase
VLKQKTIAKKISFSGIGLHSGVKVNVSLCPALANSGIIFRRIDVTEKNEIPALYNNVIQTQLGTVIANTNGISVSTIEHLMSALWACDIDNLIVEIDNEEVPIMDGSAKPFIEEIKGVGVKELSEKRKMLKILKEVSFEDGDAKISIKPDEKYSIDIRVDFPYGKIGKQVVNFSGQQEDFINAICGARTFCAKKEIEAIKSIGLAKGGSLDNAMVFDDNGLVNEGGFRYECEVARHKLLDCVGDMFTAGYFIQGKIEAHKTGHKLNNMILKKVLGDKRNFMII